MQNAVDFLWRDQEGDRVCVCVCEDVINIMNIRRSNINTCRNVIIMKEKWFCITGVRSLCRTSQWIKEPQWESEKCCCKCLIHTHTVLFSYFSTLSKYARARHRTISPFTFMFMCFWFIYWLSYDLSFSLWSILLFFSLPCWCSFRLLLRPLFVCSQCLKINLCALIFGTAGWLFEWKCRVT